MARGRGWVKMGDKASGTLGICIQWARHSLCPSNWAQKTLVPGGKSASPRHKALQECPGLSMPKGVKTFNRPNSLPLHSPVRATNLISSSQQPREATLSWILALHTTFCSDDEKTGPKSPLPTPLYCPGLTPTRQGCSHGAMRPCPSGGCSFV